MKQILTAALLVALLCGLAACTNGNRYKVSGTVTPSDSNLTLTLVDFVNGDVLDSTIQVKDGKFQIKGEADSARLVALTDDNGPLMMFVLEKGDIQATIDYTTPENCKATGTPLNEAFFSYGEQLMDIFNAPTTTQEDVDKAMEKVIKIMDEIAEKHVSDPVGFYWLLNGVSMVPDDKAAEILTKMKPYWKGNPTFDEVSEVYSKIVATSVGKKFVDFAVELDGQTTRLSDYVGKGNYVLVDFWASWCGPCRQEIPYLIEAYNQYKDKGLVVLGVATFDKVEDTKQAIEELHIPYPQILNAQKIGSDAYGIQGIPEIILFSPDGIILERGLRGEAIKEKLAEIYSKK